MNFFVKFFNLTSEQRERLSKNVLSIVSLNFFQIISQILFPPLMILIWGVDKFGLILFLIALPAGLSFLNINYTPSARQEMALAKSRGNAKDLNTIFNSTILLVLLNVFLYTAVIIIWSKFFNFNLEI